MAQFGEKDWFRQKIGEDGVSSLASCITQESLLVIMIEQEQICALPKVELCESKVGRDTYIELGNRQSVKVCGTPHRDTGGFHRRLL